MEDYEKGILTPKDTGGLELSWGDAKVILELIKQIGDRRGLGELLGQGVKRAAEKLGKGSESFAVHVKGLEVPMHDPRAFFSLAVNYATGSRGADHMRGNTMAYETGLMAAEETKQGRFAEEGKGRTAKIAQDRSAVINSMVICMFAGQQFPPARLAAILNASTGFSYTAEDLLKVGERIVNLQRAFNLRCDIDSAEDRLPLRLLEPTLEGSHAGKVPNIQEQLHEYYEARGWTEEGKPSHEKLIELGLEAVAEQLDS
jgi:aldehyde:ferredoxin oxidoreductase